MKITVIKGQNPDFILSDRRVVKTFLQKKSIAVRL